MRYLLMLVLIAGCATQPVDSAAQRAKNVQAHCRNVAIAAQASLMSQQQARIVYGFYAGAAVGRQSHAAYQAAYIDCLTQNGYDPF